MRKTHLTDLLLDLACAPDPSRAASVDDISDMDWQELSECAAQHRLEPILHDRLADNPAIPDHLRTAWRDGYRFWAMRASAAAVDLRETIALLGANGFSPLVLKGGFLAWHAYPAPALRPLRDIDILLPAAQVADAFALLRDHGGAAAMPLVAVGTKHLSPLTARCGTVIELHHRLWERAGELDHDAPLASHDAMLAQAVTIDGIAYPAAEDMLAHLIIHAVYSHRLDCGPLLLWDVYWLTRNTPIDWPRLRTRAAAERWEHGLDLTIGLCRRYLGHDAIQIPPAAGPALADDLIDAAADLLLQNLNTRRSAGLAATAIVRGIGAVAARVTRGASDRRGESERPDDRKQAAPAESLGTWTGTRLRRTVGELMDPAVRGQARDLSRLSKWLGT